MLTAAILVAWLAPQQAGPQQQQQQPPPVDHSAHGAPQTGAADDCMTAQSKVIVTGTAARVTLETAQQSNDPARMRAAVDEALIAITSLLAATEPCRQPAAMAGMDHSKMAMPQPGAPVSPRPPAAAVDPHAGHTMPSTPPAKPTPPTAKPADPHAGMKMPAASAKPGAKPADPHAGMKMPPAPPKPGMKPAAKPADPHAGHTAAPGAKAVVFADDPKKLVCTPAVDPENAPTTTYKGKAYYFCTNAERLRFLMNPETYLKEKGSGK